MPIINQPKLKLISDFPKVPVSVSNFKKAVITFNTALLPLQYRGSICTITLFEVLSPGSNMNLQRIGARKKKLTSSLIQNITTEFPQSNTFPGPSVLQHFYIAIIRIKAKTGSSSEMAPTNIAELAAASLVPI
ncbi:MAG TPA: hypothetical protein VJY62_19940 [Bacteroidia bacterium]|nr:hypothetical protein [Bacteroidia bacterium]